MAEQQVALQQKQELEGAEERTQAGRVYSPHTDIYETETEVVVAMEVPGVDKAAIDVRLEKEVLTVSAHIDSGKYEGLVPIYAEYNVGNFVRRFTVSAKIDAERISAAAVDGVLTVRLPKAAAAVSRRISIH